MDLDLDSQAGYFEHLRQMMVWGESRADFYRGTIPVRLDEYPWGMIIPAGLRRGKTLWAQWVDEAWDVEGDPYPEVTAAAARGLTPPKADDTPVTIRWACLKPTDPPTRVLYEGKYAVVKQGVRPGFGDFLQIWQEKR